MTKKKNKVAVAKKAATLRKDYKITTVEQAKAFKKANRPAAIAGEGKKTRTTRKVNRQVVKQTKKKVRGK